MYSAYVLTEDSRKEVLEYFNPIHKETICHHITHKFPDTEEGFRTIEMPKRIEIVGYACNEKVETLVCSIDDKSKREDGGYFHITLSLDKEKGAKPVDSNYLLGEKGFVILPNPLEVKTYLQLIKK